MQLIIDTANTRLSVRNKVFFIENKTTSRMISPKRVSSIAITTNCDINASVIKLAATQEIPIYFFNNFGTLQARICSPFLVNLAGLRRKQLYFYDTLEATQWVISILNQKTTLQLSHIKQLANRKPRYKITVEENTFRIQVILKKAFALSEVPIDVARNSLLGLEGSISKIYFSMLRLFTPKAFAFEKRSRRPAMDFFNAGLNYLYGMTYSIVEGGIYAKGLDPYSGFLHTDNYRKPSLVFDLIEPVRPLIDKMWMRLLLEGEINEKHFIKKEQGFWLSKEGKRIVIPAFNDYLKKRFMINSKFFSLKDYIYTNSNSLGKLIELSNTKDKN